MSKKNLQNFSLKETLKAALVFCLLLAVFAASLFVLTCGKADRDGKDVYCDNSENVTYSEESTEVNEYIKAIDCKTV